MESHRRVGEEVVQMSIWSNLTKWQNYAHYFLLTLAIMFLYKAWGAQLTFGKFLILYLFIFFIDTIVHAIFSVLPKPYRWSD